jgi:hypothetical protein
MHGILWCSKDITILFQCLRKSLTKKAKLISSKHRSSMQSMELDLEHTSWKQYRLQRYRLYNAITIWIQKNYRFTWASSSLKDICLQPTILLVALGQSTDELMLSSSKAFTSVSTQSIIMVINRKTCSWQKHQDWQNKSGKYLSNHGKIWYMASTRSA